MAEVLAYLVRETAMLRASTAQACRACAAALVFLGPLTGAAVAAQQPAPPVAPANPPSAPGEPPAPATPASPSSPAQAPPPPPAPPIPGQAAPPPAAAPQTPSTPTPTPAPSGAPQAAPEGEPSNLPPPQPPAPTPPPGPVTVPPEEVTAEKIEGAALQPDKAPAEQPAAVLVKVEVLLDRAHNSPGVIDGRPGANLDHALGFFAHERRLQPGLNLAVFRALEKVGGGPITSSYTITPEDEEGPFIGHLPSDFYAQSKFRRMGYTGPEQELAERFHMGERLLESMNPGADFSKAGTRITVVRPRTGGLGAEVAKIVVDKTVDEVIAYDAKGGLVASFPSTIGSSEHPAPRGDYTVAEIRPHPAYVYDPRVLTWGPRRHGRFTIKPGPNNPTGVVWIGLSKPTYGIHGTPHADLIGKSTSHGCVRLTNWDAWDLGKAVQLGVAVDFVGARPTQTARTNANANAPEPPHEPAGS